MRGARWIAVSVLLVSTLGARGAGSCVDLGRPCCDYCRMLLEQPAFGGEIRTTKGDTLRFDATECMAAYWLTLHGDTTGIRALRSVDYARPANRVDARRAFYLLSDQRPSPMALDLSAYARQDSARAARKRLGGRVLRWPEVLELLRRTWFREGVPPRKGG